MTDLEIYLKSETLANLIVQLKSKGISQRTFAESKLRNRFYNELGAAKLAAIWIMEHIADVEK